MERLRVQVSLQIHNQCMDLRSQLRSLLHSKVSHVIMQLIYLFRMLGLAYSEWVLDKAIEKINMEVPGLIHSDNEQVVVDICQWLRNRL